MPQQNGTVEELNARIHFLKNKLQHNDESYRTKIQQVKDKTEQDCEFLQRSIDELQKSLETLEKRETIQIERRQQLEDRHLEVRRMRKEQQDSSTRCAEVPHADEGFKIFKGNIAQATSELEAVREDIEETVENLRRVKNAQKKTCEAGQTTRKQLQQQGEEAKAEVGEWLKSAMQARHNELGRLLQMLREKLQSEDKIWHERRRDLAEEEQKHIERQSCIKEKKKALRSQTDVLSDEEVKLQRALAANQEGHAKLLHEAEELRRHEINVEVEKKTLCKKKEDMATDEELSLVDRKNMHAEEENLVKQIRAYSNQSAPSTPQAEPSTSPNSPILENNGAPPNRSLLAPPTHEHNPCQGLPQNVLSTAHGIPSDTYQQYSDPPSRANGVISLENQARTQIPTDGQSLYTESEHGLVQPTEVQNTQLSISPKDADDFSCFAQENEMSSATPRFVARMGTSIEVSAARNELDTSFSAWSNEASLADQPNLSEFISSEEPSYPPINLADCTQAHPQSDFRDEPTVSPENPSFPVALNAASTFQDICIHNRKLSSFFKSKTPQVSLFERPIAFKDTPERDDWISFEGTRGFATIREFVGHEISNESTTFQLFPTSVRVGLFAIFSVMSTNIKCAKIWAAAFRPGLVGKDLIIWDCNSNIRSGIKDPIDIADLSQHQIFLYKLLRERENVKDVYIYVNCHDRDEDSIAATSEWIQSVCKDCKKALPMAANDMEKMGFRVAIDFQIPHSEQMLLSNLLEKQAPSSDVQQQSIAASYSQSLQGQLRIQSNPVESRLPLSQICERQLKSSPSQPTKGAPKNLREVTIQETGDLIATQDIQEEDLDFHTLADEEQNSDVSNLGDSDGKCSDDDFQPYTDEYDRSEGNATHHIGPEDMITTVFDEAADQVAILTQSFISGEECPSCSLHTRVCSNTIISYLQAIKDDLERRKAAHGWLIYLDENYNIRPTEDLYAEIHQWFQTASKLRPNPTPRLKKCRKISTTQIIESAISHLKIAWRENLRLVESFCLEKRNEFGWKVWRHIRKFSCGEGNTWTRFVNVVNSSIQRRIARPGLGLGISPRLTAVDVDPLLYNDLNVETSVSSAKEVSIKKQLCIDEWGIISGWASDVSEAMVTHPVDANQCEDYGTIVVQNAFPTSRVRSQCEQSKENSLFLPADISNTHTDDCESASSRSRIDPMSPPELLFQGDDVVQPSLSLQAGVPSRKIKEGADDPYWDPKWGTTKEYPGRQRTNRARKLGHVPVGAQNIENQERFEELEWFGDLDCPIHPNQIVCKGKGLVDGKGLLDHHYFPKLLRICRTLEKAFGTKENAIKWYRNHLEELRKQLGSRFYLKQILINASKDEEYMRIEREVNSVEFPKTNLSKRFINLGKSVLSRNKKRKEVEPVTSLQPVSKKQCISIWEVPDDPLPSPILRLKSSVQKRLCSKSKQNSARLKKKQTYRRIRPADGGQYFEEDETEDTVPFRAVNDRSCGFGGIDEEYLVNSMPNAECSANLIQAAQTSLTVQESTEALDICGAASTNLQERSSVQ